MKSEITKDSLIADGWKEASEFGLLMKKEIENRNPINNDPEDTNIQLCLHNMFNTHMFAVCMPDGGMLNFIANSMEELKQFENSINFYDCPY